MLLLTVLLVLPLPRLQAQAHPGCTVTPVALAQMRGCYRPLLVFAPTAADRRLAAQRQALDEAADDMMDRNLLLVPITDSTKGFDAPLDAPYALFPAAEQAAARARFDVSPGRFLVLLLGEDGGVKLRSSSPVSVDRLNALIDSMPTRKREMQRAHAN
ncbi:MAG TPA: DUF4174 domain-containing protein [Acidobacteriaceae bacterium]